MAVRRRWFALAALVLAASLGSAGVSSAVGGAAVAVAPAQGHLGGAPASGLDRGTPGGDRGDTRMLPIRAAGASPVLRGGLSLVAAAAQSRVEARGAVAPNTAAGASAVMGLQIHASPGGPEVAVSISMMPADRSDAEARIVSLGGRFANRDSRGVEAYVPPGSLSAIAAVPGITRIDPIRRPVLVSTLASAVALQGADAWQAAGTAGSGVRVGIIDGGFSGIGALLGVDLPATVTPRCYTGVGAFTASLAACEQGSEMHGTAVAETIAAMAPAASLWVADPTSQDDLLATIDWMTTNGVRIINASWTDTGFEGPGDGTSPYPDTAYALVDDAVARGALWVNAAGNSGEQGWIGPWREDADGWLEFSGTNTSNRVTLQEGDHVVVSMRWSDPWGHAADDYDLALYEADHPAPVASSSDLQDGTGDPVETLEYDVPSTGVYEIAAHRHSGGAAARVQLIVQSQSESPLQFRVSTDTLTAPSDGANPGMLVVGAADAASPAIVEPYSGRGPTLDGRIRPDLVAADCADTRSYAPFCGTSQSTPFVSGAAADVLSAHPAWTTAQLVADLTAGAVALGAPIPSPIAGYGRLSLGPPPNVPAGLRFADEPLGGVAGAPLVVQPVVEIVDAQGNRVTGGAGATLPITLAAIGSPTQAALVLACPGGTTLTAAAGLARFAGCALGGAAIGVVLTATAGTLTAAASAPFDVTAASTPAAALGVTASAPTITWGAGVNLAVRLSEPADGSARLDGRGVDLQASRDGVDWSTIAALTTGSDGTASATYRPATNLWYRAVQGPSPDLAPAVAPPTRVVVRLVALLRPSTGTRVLSRRTSVTFSATVRPLRPDLQVPAVAYRVYRLAAGRWQLEAERSVAAHAGIAVLTWRFSTSGWWYVRASARPTPLNANSSWSPPDWFEVR